MAGCNQLKTSPAESFNTIPMKQRNPANDSTVTPDTTPATASATQVCACACTHTRDAGMVRWSTTRLQIPNGEVCAPGSAHTRAPLASYFMSVGIWLQTWDTTTWQGGAGFSYKVTSRHIRRSDVLARASVPLRPSASVSVSVPTLFTHVNTQKPHGRPLRAAAAVEYVIQMVCDCLCVCVCASRH